MPSIETMKGAERSENAVSSGSAAAMAPPMWNTFTSVSGAGRLRARSAITSIAASESSSRYCDFQYARSVLRANSPSKPDCTTVNGVGPDMSNSGVPSWRSGAMTRSPSSASPT